MTRISSVEQFRQGIDNILNQQARMNETQLQLSTGKRVNKPSDDPLATTQLLKLSTLKSKTEQYSRNIASARNELGLQETVLTGASNLLMRVRELVIQANSAAQSNETRAVISDELNNRLDELLSKVNIKPSKKRLEEIKDGIAELSVSMLDRVEVDNYLIQELECQL